MEFIYYHATELPLIFELDVLFLKNLIYSGHLAKGKPACEKHLKTPEKAKCIQLQKFISIM